MRQSQELVRGDRSGVGAWDGMGWDFGDEIMACLHVRVIVQESFISSGLSTYSRRVSSGGKGKLTWKYLAHDALIDVLTPASKVS